MTKYLKYKDIDKVTLLEVATSLRDGKLVVFPTDTVYGIGTNAYNKDACLKIYEVKGRPKQKPLSILISDISMLKELVSFVSPLEQKLIDVFWPGPLTIKFRKKEGVLPDSISAGDEYIRVRLIKEGLIYELMQIANVPVVAPSANLSGSPTGTKVNHIVQELGGKVDYILDCGDIKETLVSTIVQVEEGKVFIIREGKIKKEELQKVVPLGE